MNVETAKKILKENHYIVEREESMSSKNDEETEDELD